MSHKILLLDSVDAVCAEVFRQRGYETSQPKDWTRADLLAHIAEFDGLVVRSATKADQEVFDAGKKLKMVGRAGVGVDNVDLKAATNQGVLVMNTPDGNTISTAEHTCGLILALARNIPNAVESVKRGAWDRKKYMGTEIHGKTLGIVGLGKIGTEVAIRMHSFGMKLLVYDPFAVHEKAEALSAEIVDLDTLLANSDFVTIHTPLTEKTRDMISLKNAAKLKKGVRIVNCARGGIINEKDIPELLNSGIVAGIAVDVYSQEPPTEEIYAALKHPAVISTPHLGASTEEAQEKVAVQIAEQMADAFEQKSFKGCVNAKSIALLTNKEVQPYLELGELLGTLASQLAEENTQEFTFEYSGDAAKYSEVLTDAILKGMLSGSVSHPVNLINARVFAEERGYSVTEIVSKKTKTYTDLITVKLKNSPYQTISATVFGASDYRLVEMNDYAIELLLQGDILLYQNMDKPGMLASVSRALADRQINIGALSLGRDVKGANAITAVSVDKKLDADDVAAISGLEGIHKVKYISF